MTEIDRAGEAAPVAALPENKTAGRGNPRLSQSERAYQDLKKRILDNEMPAGFQALEQELAELLGMSRTPVREALIRLADEGIVEIRPRHGMRILPISVADMREIYEILTGLESTAAEIVATRGVNQQQLAALHAAVSDMDIALAEDDLPGWAGADERFHNLLVEFSGNERLRTWVNTCRDQAHRARMATLRLRPKPVDSNKDHAAVVEAIEKRDAEAARRIHHQHRVRAGAMLVEILELHGITQL
ncbi:GntR family transcriptional regulator [Pelagibius litoralis]|uniref:GntR family transcriptional regulator n=1 Tax=Pelagibius litoralis TaxID=374515 RepID=UPI002AC32AEF|nr:GntR family transcriptional regulator [Pelagibius litoralis]